MITQEHQAALRELYNRLNGREISWLITGSTGLALQGVPIKANDVDIRTDRKGAYEIEKIFEDCVDKKVSYSSTDKIRSHFGALKVRGIKVEIMGNIEKNVDGEWEAKSIDLDSNKRMIELDDIKLPVLSLEYELIEYRKMERHEKVEIIEKFLRTQKQI